MSGNLLRLMKIQLLDVTGWNRIKYGAGGMERARSILTASAVLAAGGVFAFYSGLMTKLYLESSMGEVVIPMMYTFCTLAGLVTNVFKASGFLFGAKDFDFLQALPISSKTVILSRFTTLYLMNLLLAACFILVPGIQYGVYEGSGLLYYISLLLLLAFAPVIPLIVSTVVGTALLAVSVRFRHKNLIMILLCVGLLVGFMGLGGSIEEMDLPAFTSLSEMVLSMIYKIFPLAKLAYLAVCQGDFLWLAAFLLLNAAAGILFLILMEKVYKKLNTAVTAYESRAVFKMKKIKGHSSFAALYRKELKRYFSSPIYVMNTAVGPILMVVAAGAVLAGYGDRFLDLPMMDHLLILALPYVFGFCAVINCTAASSVSLEGSSYWQLLVLPVKSSVILNSKRLVNYTLAVPAILLSGSLILLKEQPDFQTGIWVFLIPLCYTWMTAELGLYLNLKMPNFQWKSETAVVKQSAPVFLTVLISFACAGIPIFLLMKLAGLSRWIFPLSFGVAAVIGGIMHVLGNRIPLNQLEGQP